MSVDLTTTIPELKLKKITKNRSDLARSYEFCRKLASFTQIESVLTLALDYCLSNLAATTGSVFLYEKNDHCLVLRGIRGKNSDRQLGLSVKLGEGVTGLVAMSRRGMVVRDTRQNSFFSAKKHLYQTRSFVSAPIALNGHLVGVINVTDREGDFSFSQEDLDFLMLHSPHIAAAITRILNYHGEARTSSSSGTSVSKLTAGLSHEINNPLGGVLRYINLSLEHVERSSRAGQYLIQAKRGTRRIMGVMKSLLEFSRQTQNAARASSPVRRIVEQGLASVRDQAGEKGVWIQVDVDPHLPVVVDYGLQQVIANLVENALDAVIPGGHVRISASCTTSEVCMIVEDNGSGIDEGILDQIFDPFFSTKPIGQGTGLGLAISKEIVERGGGSMAVDSQKGIGTRFIVRAPVLMKRPPIIERAS